jgi:hypothetical protein
MGPNLFSTLVVMVRGLPSLAFSFLAGPLVEAFSRE